MRAVSNKAEYLVDNLGLPETLELLAQIATMKAGRMDEPAATDWTRAASDLRQLTARIGRHKSVVRHP